MVCFFDFTLSKFNSEFTPDTKTQKERIVFQPSIFKGQTVKFWGVYTFQTSLRNLASACLSITCFG